MTEQIAYRLEVSPAGDRLLAELGCRLGLDTGEVIRLAVALLRAAVDAKGNGKAVGYAESPDWLEAEFTGF
jgi:hypothetical protein